MNQLTEPLNLPVELLEILELNLDELISDVSSGWIPVEQLPTKEWLEKYFRLPAEDSDFSGLYNADFVPYFWGVMHALDSEVVEFLGLQKAAQIGWTMLLCGWVAKKICVEPSRILGLFPKDAKATDFIEEKFTPCVEATPELAKRVDVSSSRKQGNRNNKKNFPGGSLKVFGSNSVSNVKSTPAPLVIVEEPDDTNDSVGDQGDSIRLARERVKRFRKRKFVLGGTPSVDGLSKVQHYISLGSQRVLPITCHDCGDDHVLDWKNVTWIEKQDGPVHPVFGRNIPESAIYACPHCGSAWSDWQRQQNIYNTCKTAMDNGDPFCGWVATVENDGIIETFKDLSELYVCIPGSSISSMVQDYLEAEHDALRGDENGRIVFENSKLGKAYEYKNKDSLDCEALQESAEDYQELVCPRGGLLVTAGIDVQHDRLAIIIRAFGRNEESWLLLWREISGDTADKNDPVWKELDDILFGAFKHEVLDGLFLSAVTIDSSDGSTNHAVYNWVRTRSKKHRRVLIMAGKGDSHDNGKREIFTLPRKLDHNNAKKPSKADKHGVKVYMVGTHKAKDMIVKRLSGTSAYMHSYSTARIDYWEQVTSEVKAPSRNLRGARIWQLKSGRRNEAFDCEVYALHAAMARKVHTIKPKDWDSIEQRLSQADLFSDKLEVAAEQTAPKSKKSKKTNSRRSRGSGFVSGA
ncbi:terminase gpA endonuclease subunit [Glaciecola sp. KUL10]|uniref:terminase gpA endonuclease subunit n=1 Tax=Glaciecola sp. (strain KUL10) TaxID=2161813 RepID=UPI001314D4B6|nr:terminase gpA endonuclease subunit [Glaciecola sp. KUL10]